MPIVVAAIAVLTALVLLNLLLTFGVLRRLREHAAQLAASAPPQTLAVGATVPEFTATTDRGEPVSTATLRSHGALVVFMAPDCTACTEQLPQVREKIAAANGAVLLVITHLRTPDDASARALAESLGATDVVREPIDGPLQSAFQVAGFPSFYLVDPAGTVAAVTSSVDRLPQLVG
jgi:hypothetical protein